MTYQHRILDDLLDEAFPELAAIAIEGAKGAGKTATVARLVGVGPQDSLAGQGTHVAPATGTRRGALFETLTTQSMRVHAEATDATLGHLRTKNGDHEVDLIIETADSRYTAIEVKLGDTVSNDDTRHLHWLRDQPRNRLAEPMVLYGGPHAYRRPDGTAVIPLAMPTP